MTGQHELRLNAAETVLLVIDMRTIFSIPPAILLSTECRCRPCGPRLRRRGRCADTCRCRCGSSTRFNSTSRMAATTSWSFTRIKPAALARSNGEIPVRRGGWGAEIVSELEPRSDDVVIAKRRFDAFYQTDLEALLRRWGIKTALFAGVVGNVCVETSLRSAFVRDFDVVLARECVADWSTHNTQRTAEVVERSFGACLSNAQIACMLSSDVGT